MPGLYLMRALPTHALAVRIFDGTLHMALSNNGVWKWNVVGETATPDGEKTEEKGEWKFNKKHISSRKMWMRCPLQVTNLS